MSYKKHSYGHSLNAKGIKTKNTDNFMKTDVRAHEHTVITNEISKMLGRSVVDGDVLDIRTGETKVYFNKKLNKEQRNKITKLLGKRYEYKFECNKGEYPEELHLKYKF
jgi:F0F1-type ATP synthase delta subunit